MICPGFPAFTEPGHAHNNQEGLKVRSTLWFGALLALALAGGCYRIDIQQGNVLEQAQVERLRPGMSRTDVQRLLGSPLITDPFNQQRWDYVYNYFPSADEGQDAERRRLSLYFDGQFLARIEGDREGPDTPLASQ